MLLVKVPQAPVMAQWKLADLILAIGCGLLLIPSMVRVAQFSWSTDEGGHGPIILGTGLWLLWREWKTTTAIPEVPRPYLSAAGLALLLAVHVVARITGTLELEALSAYAALVLGAYLLVGGAIIRALWFPLLYLTLALHPPEALIALITHPMKILISEWAVSLLHQLGYPVASSGVTIQIAQYELLMAAACAGLNSLLSLSAICLFYVYVRYRAPLPTLLLVGLLVVPVAIFSNFVRVLALILITYHFGESAAQGYLHDFAGLLMFSVALGLVFAGESLFTRLRQWHRERAVA